MKGNKNMKEMENENKIKYSYKVEKYNRWDFYLEDRSFLVKSFCDYRKEMNYETSDMKNLKERELEVFMPNGDKIEILEKKNGENWEVEKFTENISGKIFNFEKGKENNNNLTYTSAIRLNDFETKRNDEFSKIVKERFNNFEKEVVKEVYKTGLEIAEFKPEEAEEILCAVKDYDKCASDFQIFDTLKVQTLENALVAVKKFEDYSTYGTVTDNETGISLNLEKGIESPILEIYLKEGKGLQDFVDVYNILRTKENFKNFENAKIKLSSGDAKATVLNNGEEIKYSGKIKVADKTVDKIAKELENSGFKKIRINGENYSSGNKEKEVKTNSR